MQWGSKWPASAMGTCCRLLKINCKLWLRPTLDMVYLNITDHFFISISLAGFAGPFFLLFVGQRCRRYPLFLCSIDCSFKSLQY